MAFTLIQSGELLKLMVGTSSIATLTIPTGVTVSSASVPRMAVFDRMAIVTNSPSRPLTVDSDGVVRVLTPLPPSSPVTLSGVAGGVLTGTFRVRQSFRVRDAQGNIISESELGPASVPVSITSDFLRADGINLSGDAVTSSMLYRTTSNGSVYFPWLEVSGNTQTAAQDDMSDASLSIVAVPLLGSAPDLTIVVEYLGRLWGVDRVDIDTLRYSQPGVKYAWPASNSILIPRPGSDAYGITGIIPRRDALGIARQGFFVQLTGSLSNDFDLMVLDENVGVMSQESVVIYHDTAYFLAHDGVYTWDSSGIKCISDGRVRNWFTTNRFFDRSKFNVAFARLDTVRLTYTLFLCSMGSGLINRWVEYDLRVGSWWGPHKTEALTPSCAFPLRSGANTLVPTIGSASGYLWQEQNVRRDNTSAIAMLATTKRHTGGSDRTEKIWGRPVISQVAQTSGALLVTPSVGALNAPPGTTRSGSLSKTTQKFPILGKGKSASLTFENAQIDKNVQISGYELDYDVIGERL